MEKTVKSKKGWLNKNYIIYASAAVLLVLFLLWTGKGSGEKSRDCKIVFLGDSIVGNVWDFAGMTQIMEERLGTKVFNGAFGGTAMSFRNPGLRPSRANSLWCMAKLAEAICYDDWSSQKAAMAYAQHYMQTNTQALDYFGNRLEQLSQIDFYSVEILLIEHGTNDYNTGQPLDNKEDPFDISTFGGALRSSLALLQKTYPKLRIILVTPLYCELGENGKDKSYNTDYGGGYMEEYIAVQKQIARDYGVEVIDVYHDSGIWEENADIYLQDRLHPSAEGHALLGNFIADYLLENSR